MSNYKWRDSPEIVAKLVNADKIQSFSKQQVLLKPNEACAMIVDGRIGDILTETLLKNMAGGFSRWVGDKLGVTANDRRLLFAMTGPMDYWIKFDGQTAGGDSVKGFANVRLKMELENIPKLLNYFANNAPIMTRETVINIISNELIGRVVTPCLATCQNSADLRSANFIERFEMTAESEMRNILSNLGFTLLKAFPITSPTDMETMEKHRTAMKAKMSTEQVNTDSALAEIANSEAVTIARIEMEANIAKARARGQVTEQLEFELKELRAQEERWSAELKFEKGKMNLRMEEADAKSRRAMEMFAEVQARKQERLKNERDFMKDRMDSQNEIQTKIMEMAAETGNLTPEVIQEFLKQQTAQKEADTGSNESVKDAVNTPKMCNCGTTIMPGWKVCPTCGVPIS